MLSSKSIILAALLALAAFPAFALLHNERDARPETIAEVELPNLVDRYGRERVTRAVLAGLKPADVLSDLVGRKVDGPSAVVWPTLRLGTLSVSGTAPGAGDRGGPVIAAARWFFDRVPLDDEAIQPVDIMIITAPSFFEADDVEGRRAWALEGGAAPESVDLIAQTAPDPSGCGGRLIAGSDGFAQAAIILPDPRLLTPAEIEGCVKSRLFASAGYTPRAASPLNFQPDEVDAVSVATINAIYQCSTDERLTSLRRAYLQAQHTTILPNTGCILAEALNILGGNDHG